MDLPVRFHCFQLMRPDLRSGIFFQFLFDPIRMWPRHDRKL